MTSKTCRRRHDVSTGCNAILALTGADLEQKTWKRRLHRAFAEKSIFLATSLVIVEARIAPFDKGNT